MRPTHLALVMVMVTLTWVFSKLWWWWCSLLGLWQQWQWVWEKHFVSKWFRSRNPPGVGQRCAVGNIVWRWCPRQACCGTSPEKTQVCVQEHGDAQILRQNGLRPRAPKAVCYWVPRATEDATWPTRIHYEWRSSRRTKAPQTCCIPFTQHGELQMATCPLIFLDALHVSCRDFASQAGDAKCKGAGIGWIVFDKGPGLSRPLYRMLHEEHWEELWYQSSPLTCLEKIIHFSYLNL